ncbi:MAG: signal peptidase I [Armatimonadetes bacterium]|nr:signal peptidase I [Armatimonadota bacterium]
MFGLVNLLAVSSFVEWVDRIARAPLSKVVMVAVALTIIRAVLHPYLKNTPAHQRYGVYGIAKLVNEVCDAVVYAGVVVFMLVRPFGIQTFYIPTGSMIDTLLLNDYVVANKFIYRTRNPQRLEIVVFKPPKRALNPDQEDSDFIKRLIGLPGEVVEWKDKRLTVDGKYIPEPFVDYTFPGNPGGAVMPEADWGSIRQANFKIIKDGDRYVPVQYTDDCVNMMPLGNSYEDEMATYCAKEFVPTSPAQAREWKNAPPAAIPPGSYLFMGDNRNGSFDGRGWGLVPRDDIIGRSEFIWFPISRWRVTR